ncbi:MAG TPA: hypothetical protein VK887_06345 [Pseudonocardiaceae bacterium]|nr:hypothetical protein [Pseudonocardiaceae bacterium]
MVAELAGITESYLRRLELGQRLWTAARSWRRSPRPFRSHRLRSPAHLTHPRPRMRP